MPDFESPLEHLESVDRLRSTIEAKISELSEANKLHKRKIFDLYTVFEITRHLNTVLDRDILFDGILLACLGQMGVQGAAIAVPDPENFRIVKTKGTFAPDGKPLQFAPTGAFVRLFTDEPAPLTVLQLQNRLPGFPEVSALERAGVALVAPMLVKAHLEGLLLLTNKLSGHHFTEGDLEFLAILANQLAVAVENARLFASEKQAYQKLREMQGQLVQAEKFAAIGELAASIAHEVNNPLGIIKNYLVLLARAVPGGEAAQEYVAIVQEEVDRIARIVRQFLDLYRPQAEQMVAVDVGTIIDETLIFVGGQLKNQNIRVNRLANGPVPKIVGSGEQLKQVFLNLLMNAKDFMPTGGQIDINVGAGNGRVKVEIADTGCGIPEENLAKIFEPFFTTKKDNNGTGLGLSVCYGIVTRHHGTIRAKNRVPHGACFTLEFPVAQE